MPRIGKPLPQITRKRFPFASKADPHRGKREKSWNPLPSDDERLELAALQNDTGTLPERIVEKWLIKEGLPYQKQHAIGGGSLHVGGSVVDFIVPIGTPPGVAVRVQGSFWHTLAPRVAKDRVQYQRLIAKGFRVATLWEHDIYEAVLQGFMDRYMRQNLYGA